ncbi:MAG: CDP-diacylglycerol--glycerol-3-phosphate 3-phosphatidyltransferase [Desulfovibrionaceae bacterium]|nr:CDP-diacylglycerol--glycerol-3-phosphate 3-phosphatidyltransferase [Desulfovibrionaceae bacterium]
MAFSFSVRTSRLNWHRLNWANRITLLRIGAIVPILLLMHVSGRISCLVATVLFVLAAFSDFLDGYIARRGGLVTNFGKFLDPLADKLLICSVIIEMVGLGWVPAWIAVLMVIRELAVTGLRAVAADNGLVIAADRYGKLKTVVQIVALVPLLLHFPVYGVPMHTLGIFILYIALLLTILSGINYFYRFFRDWAAGQRADQVTPDV